MRDGFPPQWVRFFSPPWYYLPLTFILYHFLHHALIFFRVPSQRPIIQRSCEGSATLDLVDLNF